MRRTIVSFTALALSLIIITTLTTPVKATGTVYIRTDGSIEPIITPISTTDNITYILTGDIYDSIVIERHDIVLDGNGHKTQGTGGGNGIDLTGTNNITIQNITIKDFAWAIASNLGGHSSDNKIIDSQIVNNGDGIVLYSSADYLITRNRIIGSTFQDGIWLYGCFNVQVINNDICGNKRGGVVFATGSEDNLVYDNNIKENGIGILFDSGPNKVFHNNIMDNTIQAIKRYTTSYVNVWDDGYPSGGNYWSDYTGMDTNADGIGETPYVIDGNNRDNYPLTNKRIIFVIPMLPFGTITALLTMFAALGICLVKARRKENLLARVLTT